MTTTTTTATRPPRWGAPELHDAIEEIAADARRRRVDGPGRPDRAIALVRELRLGAVRVPTGLGGGGYRKRDLFTLVIGLAEADPDVPHILRVHWSFVEERLRLRAAESDRPWLSEIVAGRLFGGASSELSNHNIGSRTYDTALTRDGGGFRLNGRKFYSTGSLYSDYLNVLAAHPDGEVGTVLVPADRAGVIHADDWDGIGQRETGSGTTVFDNVRVEADEVNQFPPRLGEGSPGQSQPQLLLHAIAAGILRAVTADAAELVRGRTRSYTWATAEQPRHDPQLLQVIGSLSAAAFVAEATVLAAADAQDRAAAFAFEHHVADPTLEHEASLLAAKTKVGLEDLALRAASDLYAVGGASATRASTHLDRHWRNLRTLFSHNPTVYKARAIGDLVTNGTELPRNVGFF
ncbi:acyl-CoA dehydrogenase family protein [Frankia tisae]|uniref:acyl-CoA dehydrogenase family protein n=1 Tax=Frankia tisae TaxID=2950104 RepID=UPI0021C11F4A|nr:acyl-CoA dehydrogenase family protein [Frankia tisae]